MTSIRTRSMSWLDRSTPMPCCPSGAWMTVSPYSSRMLVIAKALRRSSSTTRTLLPRRLSCAPGLATGRAAAAGDTSAGSATPGSGPGDCGTVGCGRGGGGGVGPGGRGHGPRVAGCGRRQRVRCGFREVCRRLRGEPLGRARIGRGQVESEGAAGGGLALRGDPPAELGSNLAADRQAEASPAVAAACGAVTLLEGFEDRLQVVVGDADAGIGDRERDLRRLACAPASAQADPEFHPARRGELDRI